MDAQMNWGEFFERSQRQWEARTRLIENLDTDPRVRSLLLALAELSDTAPSAQRRPDGTVEFAVPVGTIAWRLGKTEATAKTYIDLAGSTPYLNVRPSDHRPHTYLLRWQAIVDSLPRADSSVRSCEIEVVRVPVRGSARERIDPLRGDQTGGQLAPQQGANEGVNQGANLPPQGGDSRGQNPGLQNPGFQGIVHKNPGLKPGALRGLTAAIPQSPPGSATHPLGTKTWWAWWWQQIQQRKLSDPNDVDELYGIAVASGLFEESEQNRFRVFAQAAHDLATASKRGALFRENVAKRRWFATCDEEDHARRLMAQLDALPRTEPDRPFDSGAVADDTPLDRRSAVDKLKAWAASR